MDRLCTKIGKRVNHISESCNNRQRKNIYRILCDISHSQFFYLHIVHKEVTVNQMYLYGKYTTASVHNKKVSLQGY